MKHHAPSGAIQQARRLRRDMTDAEKAMWRLLRESFPEARWRKPVPIRQYIADFASHAAKLVIEVDGGQHSPEMDASRTSTIEADGYRVIRFWNDDVLGNPDGVWSVIDSAMRSPHPHLTLPHQGGGL